MFSSAIIAISSIRIIGYTIQTIFEYVEIRNKPDALFKKEYTFMLDDKNTSI